jgi:hypothetical protein
MKKSSSILVGLAVAASAVLVGAPAAHAATPTVAANPAKNIKNGATLTLTVKGFKTGAALAAVQCTTAKPAAGGVGCNIGGVVMFTAKKGTTTTKIKVQKNQGNYIFVGTVDQTQSTKAFKIAFK